MQFFRAGSALSGYVPARFSQIRSPFVSSFAPFQGSSFPFPSKHLKNNKMHAPIFSQVINILFSRDSHLFLKRKIRVTLVSPHIVKRTTHTFLAQKIPLHESAQ